MAAPVADRAPGARGMSRRDLMGAGAGAGLAGLWLPAAALAAASGPESVDASALAPVYVAVRPDGTVEITVPAAEIGQGVTTSLCQIIAEEMDADWASVRFRLAGAGAAFANPGKGAQAVGRSMSVRGYWMLLRRVGATARARLAAAAAAKWGVPVEQVTAAKGRLAHTPSGRSLAFAEVAVAAAAGPMPAKVVLKDPARFTLIGASPPRLDLPAKVDGSAVYGIDVKVPGMLVAAITTAPALGGALESFQEAAATASPGVRHVVRTEQGLAPGLAICADTYWQAASALRAAAPKWTAGPHAKLSSEGLAADRAAALKGDGLTALETGDLKAAFAAAAHVTEGGFEAPFLSHGCMEPMTAVADVRPDGCTLWVAAQAQTRARDAAAKLLGLAPEKVVVNTVMAGGGFGRRWQVDYVLQAVELSRACGKPVKLIWSREEDTTHDWYRPAVSMRYRAAQAADGTLQGLEIKLAGDSLSEWGKPRPAKPTLDSTAASGISDTGYAIPAFRIGVITTPSPVPIGTWRSVGHSQNVFFLESLIDELAAVAKADPLAFRRTLLAGQPRHLRVLESLAKLSAWGRPKAAGEGRGVAICEAYGSVVGEVVDITIKGEALTLNSVSCVIDCGRAVSPDGVRAQMEGGIIFGLSAALTGDVAFSAGAPQAANFSDNMPLLLAQTPRILVEILQSDGPLGGAGEPGLPCVAPALLAAVFDATGKRHRELPLARAGIGV